MEEMEASEKHIFNHFSHQHPLENTVSVSTEKIVCYGCNLQIWPGKDYYECKTCSFSLHRICSNMPRKTRHPSHPNHYLNLLVSPPSSINTSKCKACANDVSGFCYNCAECGVSYHILCCALPLSLAISSHPHALKIEFSPPYDFSCDLCGKSNHLGWLYRCRFCEFDSHTSCAISDHKDKPVPPSNILAKQTIYAAPIMEANGMIDYETESTELMQLVVQGLGIAHCSAVSGWDKRLRSPKESNAIVNASESQITSPLHQSEDSTIPSIQFSDMCFSIDLLKSYASQDHKSSPENKEGTKLAVDYRNRPVFNPLYRAPENWLNDDYLLEGVKEDNNIKTNAFGVKPSIREQTVKSSTVRLNLQKSSRRSCWWKLLSCFYPTDEYQKCSKSFKNGGL